MVCNSMATLTKTTPLASLPTSQFLSIRRSWCSHVVANPNAGSSNYRNMQYGLCRSFFTVSRPSWETLRSFKTPILALNSGLEASITDSNENSSILKNAEIVVESEDGNKLQLRVDLNGDQTQRVFNQVLTNLARTAPPIPGFRRQKGAALELVIHESLPYYIVHVMWTAPGKTSKVPTDFLLQMLGEERVIKFVIQEILNLTMADYVKKEDLDVKDRNISTIQTAEELKRSFTPGNEFGFNVIIEPQKS